MKTDIFHLQIIPISNILPHEEFDEKRAIPLVSQLKKDGYLANPIIVAQIDNGKYLQLDGMNRFSAFKMMKIPTVLAQIIDYNDQDAVELSSWVHLFQLDAKSFFLSAESMEGVFVKRGKIENVGHRYIRSEGLGRLCTVVGQDGSVSLISTGGTLMEKIKRLNKLVACYKQNITRDVLPLNFTYGGINFLFQEHPNINMMLVFPTFSRHQIVEVVKEDELFPPGVTRHIIKRRCLNVKVPLSFFKSGKSVVEQNKELERFINGRSFRLYEEPTIYFE